MPDQTSATGTPDLPHVPGTSLAAGQLRDWTRRHRPDGGWGASAQAWLDLLAIVGATHGHPTCTLCGDEVVWHPGNGGQWLGAHPPRDWAHCGGSAAPDAPIHQVTMRPGAVREDAPPS